MTMESFKKDVTSDTRIRGARFNVDFQTAQTDVYCAVPKSPDTSPVSKLKASRSSLKVLALDAFGKGKMDEIRELKAEVREKDKRIASLEAEVENLKKQLQLRKAIIE